MTDNLYINVFATIDGKISTESSFNNAADAMEDLIGASSLNHEEGGLEWGSLQYQYTIVCSHIGMTVPLARAEDWSDDVRLAKYEAAAESAANTGRQGGPYARF